MANIRVRSAIVRVDSKKIGEMYNATFTTTSGDEPVIGAEGVVCFSDGAPQAKLTAKTFIPVAGLAKDLPGLVLQKKRSKVTFFAGGTEYVMDPAAALEFEITSERKSGMLDGTFTFASGNPATAS